MHMKGRRELSDLALAVDMDVTALERAAEDAFGAGVSLDAFVQSVRALHGRPLEAVRPPLSREDIVRQFESVFGAKWPERHPLTDAPFVRVDRPERTQESRIVSVAPPVAPSRQVAVSVDDDGMPLESRTLSDVEYAEAVERYGTAAAEWKRSGGLAVAIGPVRITACFSCGDGTWCRGLYLAGEWVWLESYPAG